MPVTRCCECGALCYAGNPNRPAYCSPECVRRKLEDADPFGVRALDPDGDDGADVTADGGGDYGGDGGGE
jgi:hypothetical protein